MKIVADENIRYVSEAFEGLGEVVLLPGRAIASADVRDADLLLVRSVTQVNADLLQGAAVRFVATATIGEDHIDRVFLEREGIAFASAPGCNANSVGEYLVASLLHLADKYDFSLASKSLGIVGVGNVGTNVAQKAEALGMRVVLNDPPRAAANGDPRFRPLEEILACDIVTTHVPLTNEGPHPTRHLVDEAFLKALKPGSCLINTARGPVVHNDALLAALQSDHIQGAVLDVWEHEPEVDLELLAAVDIASPHIAGYSFDGKVKGTVQIYEAACRFLEVPATWTPDGLLPEPEHPILTLEEDTNSLKKVVDTLYPIMEDDARMRIIAHEVPENRHAYFDMLRKTYPRRREFYNTQVSCTDCSSALSAQLEGLGFSVNRPALHS